MTSRTHAKRQERSHLKSEIAIRKKQENPLIGEWRLHAALLQEGIKLSPRTCGRIMAKNRAIYGWDKPKAHPSLRKRCPLKPLGGTSIGALTYGISSITSFPISKVQSM